MRAKRIGVLGGTFNPIHQGHLHIARRTMSLFDLNQIHFVVATIPPHKNAANLVPLAHRYAMVSLATAGNRSFIPSLVELEPPASPYSIHTMGKLAREIPGSPGALYFIAGGDSLLDVGTWRCSEELLSSYSFVFVTRPRAVPLDVDTILPAKLAARTSDLRGMGPRQLRRHIDEIRPGRRRRIFVVDLAAPDISASQIRSLVSSGRRVRHLVPPEVNEYLQKLNLYGERCKKK